MTEIYRLLREFLWKWRVTVSRINPNTNRFTLWRSSAKAEKKNVNEIIIFPSYIINWKKNKNNRCLLASHFICFFNSLYPVNYRTDWWHRQTVHYQRRKNPNPRLCFKKARHPGGGVMAKGHLPVLYWLLLLLIFMIQKLARNDF